MLSSAGESLSLHPCPGLMAVTTARVLDPRRSLGGTEPEFSTVGIGVQTTEESLCSGRTSEFCKLLRMRIASAVIGVVVRRQPWARLHHREPLLSSISGEITQQSGS